MRSDVGTAVNIKLCVLFAVKTCSLVERYKGCEGICCLPLQVLRELNREEWLVCRAVLVEGVLSGRAYIYLEDGRSKFCGKFVPVFLSKPTTRLTILLVRNALWFCVLC